MMHDEFVELTGVTVSPRYYTERIEPDYRDGDWADKQEFCAQWLKSNKTSICKAHSIDLSGLHRDIACYDAMKTRSEEDRAAKSRAEDEIRDLNNKLGHLTYERDEYGKEAEDARAESREVKAENDKLNTDLNEAHREIFEARIQNEKMAQELVALKAKLYDLMTAVA